MCGLVGIAGDLALKDEATMKRLLLFDFLRGTDSTGLASIRTNGDVKIAKLAVDPITLFDHEKFKQALSGSNSYVLMGHNRAATRGGTNNYNAHPFHYGHIVGAHNGTLDTKSWDALEKALDEKFAVDSQALIAAIAKFGVKEAIGMCTEGKDSTTGAWSLTWFDEHEGTLNFLRNKHRPMWFAWEKDFKRLFWASEWWMIDAAIRSSGAYELYAEGKEGFKYFPTEENVHLKFDIGAWMNNGGKKPKPKVATVKGKEPLPVVKQDDPFGRHGNVCGMHIGSHTLTNASKTNSTTKFPSSATPRSSNPDNVIHWLANVSNPLAGYIDEKKFNELAKYGCSWCQSDVQYGDPGITLYERDDMLLCSKCSGHDVITEETPSRIYATAGNFEALR